MFHVNARSLRDFDYVVVSHHPRSHTTSPCTSVHHLFLADGAPFGPARHHHLDRDDHVSSACQGLGRPCFVFNSFSSLTRESSLTTLMYAMEHQIPCVVYWHETAWNLREFLRRDEAQFALVRTLLASPLVQHWVPTFQNAQFLMFLFGISLEAIEVVFETVDVDAIQALAGPLERDHVAPERLRFAGAGLPDLRKGIDLFNELSSRLPGTFDWFSPRANAQLPGDLEPTPRFRWQGNVKNFPNAIKHHHAFLMTSRDDPSPIVCLEALSLGIPTFAFGTTGYAEVLPEEFLCRHLDDMAAKVEAYVANRSQYRPEFFESLARRHDVSKLESKLRRSPPSVTAEMPSCDDGPLLGAPTAMVAKLGDALRRLHQATQSQERWRESYRSSVREIASLKKEHEAAKTATLLALREDSRHRVEALETSRSFLKDAHRQARIELKPGLRSRLEAVVPLAPERVVLVGNSPSALRHDTGALIDASDVVIRVNNFQIDGFERHVGTKTDLVVFTPACRPNDVLRALGKDRRLLHAANFHADREKLQERLLREDAIGLRLSDLTILPPTLFFYGLSILMDLPPGVWASTGSVALQLMLDVFSEETELSFVGIDFFAGMGRTIEHYFPHQTRSDGKHDWEKERKYFQRFVNAGRLVPLGAF